MKKLVSLKQFNENQCQNYLAYGDTKCLPNGIACPKCGLELVDTDRSRQLASYPPQYNIHCENKDCNYHGYRLV